MNALKSRYVNLPFKKNWHLTEKSNFLLGMCVAYIKAISNTPILPEHKQKMLHVAFIKGAQSTTAIEGNTLSNEEIEKVSQGQKIAPSKEYQAVEVTNVINAFNTLFNSVITQQTCQIISPDLLRDFNRMIGQNLNDHFAAIPGRFRTNNVVVGSYKCPDYEDVEGLIDLFCDWLRNEFKYETGEQLYANVIIQAIVSHVYFELIHPFGDGNGRTGRLLEFYILIRSGTPNIASHLLTNYYNTTRSEYYIQLANATQKRNLTEFIEYALTGFVEGLEETLNKLQESQFIMTWQKVIYDKFSSLTGVLQTVSKRRRALILGMPLEQEFKPSQLVSLNTEVAKLYANIAPGSLDRDLNELIGMDLLIKTADKKYKAKSSIIDGLKASKKE